MSFISMTAAYQFVIKHLDINILIKNKYSKETCFNCFFCCHTIDNKISL